MNYGWIVANCLIVVASSVCAVYINHGTPREERQPLPWRMTLLVFGITAIVTTLQFVQPATLNLLDRDPEALRSGELWRLVTPLFVQPAGLIQCIMNASLLFIFMPASERIYGKGVLAVYFGAGIIGQITNFLWDMPLRGGSSTAIFGLMGSLLVYVIRNRRRIPTLFLVSAFVGFIGAATSIILRDGHGAGLLAGAALGVVCLSAGPAKPARPPL
ncbi:MAG: rhomboid family intramembrane serine protease [Sphingomonas sp.]